MAKRIDSQTITWCSLKNEMIGIVTERNSIVFIGCSLLRTLSPKLHRRNYDNQVNIGLYHHIRLD
jgi:hypothetical protein